MRDGEAKTTIANWPAEITCDRKWRRIRNKSDSRQPYLYVPGSRAYAIQSDALYAYFGQDEEKYIEYVDVVAIEVCGSRQNFYDKRSRYIHQNALALDCKSDWLKSAHFIAENPDFEPQNIPVRYRAVLFIIDDEECGYIKQNLPPWPHEFYCGFSQIARVPELFMRMLPEGHFFS